MASVERLPSRLSLSSARCACHCFLHPSRHPLLLELTTFDLPAVMLDLHKAVPLVAQGLKRPVALSRSCHPRSSSIPNEKYHGLWIFRCSGNTTTSTPFSFTANMTSSVIAAEHDATAWGRDTVLCGCGMRKQHRP